MTDMHIRGLHDPDVVPEGMPATGRLWASEDPYDLEGTTLIVSRGLARESTRVPRFFNPPEVVVIDVMAKAKK